MTFTQPLLNLLGPLPAAGPQARLEFRQRRTLHLRRRSPAMLALKQTINPTRFERRRRQQSLLAFGIFAGTQFSSHSLRQVGTPQVVSLRHIFLCTHSQNSAISNSNWY